MTSGLTRKLALFTTSGAQRLMTPAVRQQASRAILDTVAVTIAGGAEQPVQCLEASLDVREGANTSNTSNTSSTCPSPWSGRRYGTTDAALLYGMASHMFDYDDVSMLAVCHPSAPVLSALAAAMCGAGRQVAGGEVLTAFATGTEVLVRVGQAMGFRHYALGFHTTATLGAVGAAAAVASLQKLDPTRTAHALAIAASMAGGLRKNFGSPVKPLHVGLAAASGLRAVRMAAAGVEGAAEAFESQGFLHAFSGGETDSWPHGLSLGEPFVLVEPGFEQKRYPCCYMLHKIIEAALQLRRESGCSLDDLATARVVMPQGGTKPLIHPYPQNGLNAKFSTPYAVVACLLDGKIDLASFLDASVLRPQVQARLRDVEVVEEDQPPPPDVDLGRLPVTLELKLRDGSLRSATILPSPGSREDPMTTPQLRAKWLDCFQLGLPRMSAQAAGQLFDEGVDFEAVRDPAAWLARAFGQSVAPLRADKAEAVAAA